MFDVKKQQLFEVPQKSCASVGNSFINAASKKTAETRSGNGALKYDTTDDVFVDQFSSLSTYKAKRDYKDIERDMIAAWASSPRLTLCFTFFLRMITRVVCFFDNTKTESVQRGSGLKHEGIMRMLWIYMNHQNVFWNNIHLWVSIGSWKDIFEFLRYDLIYNGWDSRVIDWDRMGSVILAGLENPNTSELVKKYLPQIKARSACTTVEAQANNIISKWLCFKLFGGKNNSDNKLFYKSYRMLKNSGKAHQWQQLISKKLYNEIDFNTIHGRALATLVGSSFLKNAGLESKYNEWISKKPVAKFTGFVHELFAKIGNTPNQIMTLNKQFEQLVSTARQGANQNAGLIVVRDTSASMNSLAIGTKVSSNLIAKSIALFFSEMLQKGPFANSYIEFAQTARMVQWKGSTPYEKWICDTTSVVGNTNFQSVIDLFCTIHIAYPNMQESEFPSGILCISDQEFDPASLRDTTNVDAAKEKLLASGFSKKFVEDFKIVLWNIPNSFYGSSRQVNFETFGDGKNVFYFSGYDPSTVAFLTGLDAPGTDNKVPSTAKELFLKAMDQEVLKHLEI